jgi:hypothetical protein
MDDAIRDAQKAIAELRAAGLPVPLALHRAAHALAYASEESRA